MQNDIRAYLEKTAANFGLIAKNEAVIAAVANAAQACIDSIAARGTVIWCGNGGSAADAQHMAAELSGRYKAERDALPSLALTVDTSALTAIGNDYGFEQVFARQLRGIGRAGDVLIGISTSGNSANIIEAFKDAKRMGLKTIALTGESGGKMKGMVDIWIGVPSSETNHIQEMHVAVEHMICGHVEQAFLSGRP